MKTKIRIVLTVAKEIERDSDWYPPGTTEAQMDEEDKTGIIDDPFTFIDAKDVEASVEITKCPS